MRNAVNAAYFIGTTAPMYKINPSLSVFHTIPELVLAKSLFLKNVTTPSVACVAGVERGRGRGNLGARESVWGAPGGKERKLLHLFLRYWSIKRN